MCTHSKHMGELSPQKNWHGLTANIGYKKVDTHPEQLLEVLPRQMRQLSKIQWKEKLPLAPDLIWFIKGCLHNRFIHLYQSWFWCKWQPNLFILLGCHLHQNQLWSKWQTDRSIETVRPMVSCHWKPSKQQEPNFLLFSKKKLDGDGTKKAKNCLSFTHLMVLKKWSLLRFNSSH